MPEEGQGEEVFTLPPSLSIQCCDIYKGRLGGAPWVLDTERELDTDVDVASDLDELGELDGLLGGVLEVVDGEDFEAGLVDLERYGCVSKLAVDGPRGRGRED